MSRPQEQVEDQAELDEEIISGNGEADEVMDEVDEGYTSSTPTSTLTWISWFCSLPGHEYFCEVSEDFIEDDFNLTGLNTMVPFWKEAMEMVLDVEPDEDTSKIPDVSIVEASAELLYWPRASALHPDASRLAVDKYENAAFGVCPRVYCVGCNVVPCGRSDLPGIDTVKLYCPNCNDIYSPPSSRFQGVDGAFFGTTFAHLFFQSYRELSPAPFWKPSSSTESSLSPGRSPDSVNSSQRPPFVNPNPHGGQKRPEGRIYEPRIYGFKVSERAKSGPRMQWLRLRPQSPEELDMVDWRGRWIDDEEYGDVDDDDDNEEVDKQMEDFDPDVVEDDDEEEEEEEEEEGGARRQHVRGEQSVDLLRPPTPIHLPSSARTSPAISKGQGDLVIGTNGTGRAQDYASDVGHLGVFQVRAWKKTVQVQATDTATLLTGVLWQTLVETAIIKTVKIMARSNLRYGLNKGHPTTAIPKTPRPSHRKGILSTKNKFVRSVIREVAGFSPYERRVLELLRNSKDKKARKLTKKRLGTLLRSKRKLEELGAVIQESRRAH
ncbi:casein kinase II regulatory subunit-domain-containing protein [Boletus reticuloceps]|uniref:Multifunctional fusion protein n=1 Tax=Boletus reticuloceps TaxID=495285 RepID=A0A8I2YY12_9AGAM|nr:casein kinase II regulatory subunit-domain-containing protein [Boletus reticuloceps]